MTQMIDAPVRVSAIQSAYNLWSLFYGSIVVPMERKPRLRGIELAAIQPHDRILEVAVGTGAALLEMLKRVDKVNVVHGVDLTPGMLEKARRTVAKAGFTNVDLRLGDARSLPFDDNAFDVLFNSYMLDLIPLADMPTVLGEFRRVLKKNGRLVMVNMSKEHGITLWERLYQATPVRLVPYLYGGCRPVLMDGPTKAAGFREVQREFVKNIISSEVLVARK
ncbi:MAG TPA: ubiquinone biosynthesis protein UbiE [Anaerolineaceae bacterium]|nr:ubiquinone biosynthesis protein UbiE [Anaerolineaceae bacterium]HBA90478.1 ubiquinone biosynthesis protein UbiE [Anaerolineaceae bacterium]